MTLLLSNIKFFLKLSRGLFTLNFLKLNLLFKIFFFEFKKNKKESYYKDIFLITSCINHLDTDNINYNIDHTSNQRLDELVETINSIKSIFKENYKIIICENSIINSKQKNKILIHANQILDISKKKLTLISRKIENKGVPWSVSIIFSCLELNKYNYERLHFVTGRYKLNEKFSLLNFQKNKINFKYYKEHNNVSTRYFCYTRKDIFYIFKLIKKVLYVCLLGEPAENGVRFFSSYKNYIYNEIGVEGKVNGVTFIKE